MLFYIYQLQNSGESNNELYLKQIDPSLEKNFRREGNIVYYEWSDEYFEKKERGVQER